MLVRFQSTFLSAVAFTVTIVCIALTPRVVHAQAAEPAKPTKPTKPSTSYSTPSEIPVDTFFRRKNYSLMSISPDGKRLAALKQINGRDNLVVIDLLAGKTQAITGYKDRDVSYFAWVSNDRLYFQSADMQEATGAIYLSGAFAIDVDGSNERDLMFPLERGAEREARRNTIYLHDYNFRSFRILSRTFDGSGDVIAEISDRNKLYSDVYRYNTKTMEYKRLTASTPGNVFRWVLDRNLVPRIAIRHEERKDPSSPREQTIWHRAGEGQPWESIGVARGKEDEDEILPLAFDYDNHTLYVSAHAGQDRRGIFKYDIAGRKLGEQLFRHPLIDLGGSLIFSRQRKALVGLRYAASTLQATWFDEDMARLQNGIDKALPDTTNVINFADENNRYVLIDSSSDTHAGGYFLYDREKRQLEQVAKSREWLPPALMSKRRFIKYKTRDGMEIPAWVTIPVGSDGKNLPLVVNIHGGPWVRGYNGIQWGRWPNAQFLASRGYVVLEPEPRGSTGFGKKHYTASFKQWGLAMQDDITDGALHLVKEGIVDKSRMCLFGGSYGGYAALQGLVKDPELWRCGVAFVAVTDLELQQSVAWSDTSRRSDFLETDFKRYVGDKDRDRERFLQTSPAKNADKIKAPVLLAMGGLDERVPQIHGTTMQSAMKRAGSPMEYVVYPDEAHGFNKDENVIDFYTRLEKFLARNLKP